MKKNILYSLSIALTLLVAGCGSSMGDVNDKVPITDNNGAITNDITKEPEVTVEQPIIESQVIYDKDNIKITASELSYDGFFGPEIKVLIENNSDKSITVQADKSSINGVMVDNMFSADVASQKKTNDEITFTASTLEHASINTIQSFEFILKILDPDTYDDIDTTDFITIKTNADPSYVQTFDDSGFVAYDEDDIKVVVKKISSTDSFWGSDVYLYIENNTNKNVTIQAEDVSIDGFMVDPFFSADVLAGKKAFDSMSFMESDLEENNVEDIKSLEFKLNIFDSDTWDDIKVTDVITVEFEK